MSNDLKRIERSVNTIVGKPVSWAVYGLVLGVRYGYRGLVRCGSWLQARYAGYTSKA